MDEKRLRKLAGIQEGSFETGKLQFEIEDVRISAKKLNQLLQNNSTLSKGLKELGAGLREFKIAQRNAKALEKILEDLQDTVEDTLEDLIDAQR